MDEAGPSREAGRRVETTSLTRSSEKTHHAGRIQKLELTQFMMCTTFECEFLPNTTFFVEQNKKVNSAIFQAITLGFGDWANIGASDEMITDLIQEGKETATIRFSLDNTGYNRYQHERFGNVIIIEHALSRRYFPTCKIIGSNGETIYKDHDQYKEILFHFKIRIFNMISVPILCLGLSGSVQNYKHEAYEMLLKMTSMGDAWEMLRQNKDKARQSMRMLDGKKADAVKLKNELDALEWRWSRVMVVKEHRARIDKLQGGFLWAMVIEEEAVLAKFMEKYKTNPVPSSPETDKRNVIVEEQEVRIARAIQVAIKVCPQRVDLKRTVDEVRTELKQREEVVSQLERDNGHYSAVLVDVAMLRRRYNKMIESIHQLDISMRELDRALNIREIEYIRVQRLTFDSVASCFADEMYAEYRVTARLKIDHKDKSLAIEGSHKPIPFAEVMAVYITALWEHSDMPFFLFYDDAFADISNSAGVKLLWKFMSNWTHTKCHSQFISLLPASMHVSRFSQNYVRKQSCVYVYIPSSELLGPEGIREMQDCITYLSRMIDDPNYRPERE